MSELNLVKSWLARARAVEKGHFKACLKFREKHNRWGIALVSISALSTAMTGVIATYEDSIPGLANALTPLNILFAVVVPVLAAQVAFFSFESRSNKHHDSAARFAGLKRQLSIALVRGQNGKNSKVVSDTLDSVIHAWDELTLSGPALYLDDWEESIAKCEQDIERMQSA